MFIISFFILLPLQRIAEVALTLLKVAPHDPVTMGCKGLQRLVDLTTTGIFLIFFIYHWRFVQLPQMCKQNYTSLLTNPHFNLSLKAFYKDF